MEDKDYSVFYDMIYESKMVKASIDNLSRHIRLMAEKLPPAQQSDLRLNAKRITNQIDDLMGDIDGYSSICIQRAAEHLAKKLEASK